MKTCFKCGQSKPKTEFYRHSKMADGLLNKCKSCTKRDVAGWYRKTRDERVEYERARAQTKHRKAMQAKAQKKMRKNNPEKYRARNTLNKAIRSGIIKRKPCEVCGARAEAHHPDYAKPLDVRWFCRTHHRIAHGKSVFA